jgi:hypothetical protein
MDVALTDIIVGGGCYILLTIGASRDYLRLFAA